MTNRVSGYFDLVGELDRLGDLWRDAFARLRLAKASDAIPDDYRPRLETTWRREIQRIEIEAAREVLVDRDLMFRDEADMPGDFEPVYWEYAKGRAIYVAPGCVKFSPDEPALLPNATEEADR